MKTAQEINVMYKDLFKKYFSEFLRSKSKQIPENCIFNIRSILDSRDTVDGHTNPAYNRIGSVSVKYGHVIVTNEESIQLEIDNQSYLIPKSEIHSKVGELEQFSGYILLSHKYVSENLPYIQIPTIGICKVALKTEVRICEDEADASKCPAYISMYSKSNVEKEFWRYAETIHKDLIILKDISGTVTKPSLWQIIKTFFSFRKEDANS
jgi:hypothetical protein